MGRGTWYYSLGVLAIVDVFVRSEFGISSWRGSRVDVRTYLLGGAIDSSESNEIIRDPKLELESVDVVVGENWLLRHKAEMVAFIVLHDVLSVIIWTICTQDTIMSDFEHSTVTYTSVSEDDLDMGSPGIEVPIFEVPPSPDYIPGPEGPPSPDYVPGPEEPEQAPPSPIYIPFVPELVYPEFLPN
ncbi:hypothetical protein Tco_1246289 [Tanacetum coccineum]